MEFHCAAADSAPRRRDGRQSLRARTVFSEPIININTAVAFREEAGAAGRLLDG